MKKKLTIIIKVFAVSFIMMLTLLGCSSTPRLGILPPKPPKINLCEVLGIDEEFSREYKIKVGNQEKEVRVTYSCLLDKPYKFTNSNKSRSNESRIDKDLTINANYLPSYFLKRAFEIENPNYSLPGLPEEIWDSEDGDTVVHGILHELTHILFKTFNELLADITPTVFFYLSENKWYSKEYYNTEVKIKTSDAPLLFFHDEKMIPVITAHDVIYGALIGGETTCNNTAFRGDTCTIYNSIVHSLSYIVANNNLSFVNAFQTKLNDTIVITSITSKLGNRVKYISFYETGNLLNDWELYGTPSPYLETTSLVKGLNPNGDSWYNSYVVSTYSLKDLIGSSKDYVIQATVFFGSNTKTLYHEAVIGLTDFKDGMNGREDKYLKSLKLSVSGENDGKFYANITYCDKVTSTGDCDWRGYGVVKNCPNVVEHHFFFCGVLCKEKYKPILTNFETNMFHHLMIIVRRGKAYFFVDGRRVYEEVDANVADLTNQKLYIGDRASSGKVVISNIFVMSLDN